jgi:hypothetical protein
LKGKLWQTIRVFWILFLERRFKLLFFHEVFGVYCNIVEWYERKGEKTWTWNMEFCFLIWWCNFLFSIMKDWRNYNVLIRHLCRVYNIIAIIMNIIILVFFLFVGYRMYILRYIIYCKNITLFCKIYIYHLVTIPKMNSREKSRFSHSI